MISSKQLGTFTIDENGRKSDSHPSNLIIATSIHADPCVMPQVRKMICTVMYFCWAVDLIHNIYILLQSKKLILDGRGTQLLSYLWPIRSTMLPFMVTNSISSHNHRIWTSLACKAQRKILIQCCRYATSRQNFLFSNVCRCHADRCCVAGSRKWQL